MPASNKGLLHSSYPLYNKLGNYICMECHYLLWKHNDHTFQIHAIHGSTRANHSFAEIDVRWCKRFGFKLDNWLQIPSPLEYKWKLNSLWMDREMWIPALCRLPQINYFKWCFPNTYIFQSVSRDVLFTLFCRVACFVVFGKFCKIITKDIYELHF